MTGRTAPPILTALLAALVAGCGAGESEPPPAAVTVVDAGGRQVALPGTAQRIVSLVPSATQTLRTLGVSDRLVGRTDFDQAPWLADVPSVGGGLEPNLEAIVALRPDLVIRFEGQQDTRTPARLDELGIAHMAIRPDRIDDVYESVALIGAVTGAEGAADSVVAGLRSELAALEIAVNELPRRRVVYVLGGTPPWVAGPGTYVHEIVGLAGGDNAFSDLSSLYASVSREELRAREIDVVLVSGSGDFDASLTPDARVVDVGDALELPGPEMAAAAWHVAELLHGRPLR